MDLFLNQTQRLNLHALIGAQRGSVDEVRMWWRLQDTIALDDEERAAINYRTVRIGEVEQPVWDLSKVRPRRYEFLPDDAARLERLVREWPNGYTAADRHWLEPLLAQLEKDDASASGEAAVQSRDRA